MKKYQKKNFYITFIFLFISVFIRIISINYFGDNKIGMEWEILLHNLSNFGTLGINVFDGFEVLQKKASEGQLVLPSVFMPPFYVLFLYCISLVIEANELFVLVVLCVQLLVSLLSLYFFYLLLSKFYSKKITIIGATLFSVFPLNVYAVSQISSIVFQIFFLILFLYFLFQLLEKKNFITLLKFSSTASMLVLLRGEFFLFYLLTLIFIFIQKIELKFIILSSLITLIIISPYLARNYKTYDHITLTKSAGFNLWKGNNKYSGVEGSEKIYDKNMMQKIKKIKPDKKYEIKLDNLYKKEAIGNIFSEPKMYLNMYIKKVFSFIFFNTNSNYPNYYNLFHILPKIFISITTLIGIFLIKIKNNNLYYFSLYYILNISFFSLFFILPRYELTLLPVQIILSCYILKKKFN
jgi:hypothetical protein